MFDTNVVKKLYPGVEDILYPPMLIYSGTKERLKKACESGEYFGQLKKDGAFYQFVKGKKNTSYLFGRTVSKKTNVLTEKIENVPHIKEALDCLPPNTVIIGEIYYPGGSSRDTIKIMGCVPRKAIERQKDDYGLIHYYIYDILCYNGKDFVKSQVGNENRYNFLKKIYKEYNLDCYPFLELAESWTDNLYLRISLALENGEEGMVIKKKEGIYVPGKRPVWNLKAKKTDSKDVVIIGFEEPTKEYNGKEIETWLYWISEKEENKLPIGFHYEEIGVAPVTKAYYMDWMNSRVKIGAYNENNEIEYIGTIHSGISDRMKEDMSKNPEKYLNHVAKIQMMEVNAEDHTIRHGFFLNMRDDKPETDCTLESIFS